MKLHLLRLRLNILNDGPTGQQHHRPLILNLLFKIHLHSGNARTQFYQLSRQFAQLNVKVLAAFMAQSGLRVKIGAQVLALGLLQVDLGEEGIDSGLVGFYNFTYTGFVQQGHFHFQDLVLLHGLLLALFQFGLEQFVLFVGLVL